MAVKQRLSRGEYLCGAFLSIRSAELAEIIAQAGFDFIIIDSEHCSYDWSEIEQLIKVISYNRVSPIVRVPGIFRPLILRTLDLGAEGILVPRVDSAREAQDVVRFAKYPPLGDRGFAGIVRSAKYGKLPVREYIEQANENILLAVQAETAKAVDNLGEIASVRGIDLVFVGPSDLSVSLGFAGRPNASEVQEKIE
ncbi:MAG: aldolase/citrate lyase family protein, partial [Firmicutes bacterium]|nr:aldolase/citrate lyase family protein [Bacillota bacterium]